ncbi:hypothetical protein B0H11DRAFT_1856682 [Mycena galericulata]|nr:hypothetical protein B0H11DRAFT_1856682 [Mycena galericulata]
MACGAITKDNLGITRLFRILVSESAHLIWRLRCERVIQQKGPASIQEIHKRWLKTMNNRLALDRVLTDKLKYGKRSLKKPVVLDTWRKVLKNEETLPRDWTREVEVLVGIG